MTNLIDCPDCNHQISEKAKSCPKCGRPITAKDRPHKKMTSGRLISILLFAFIFFGIIALIGLVVNVGIFLGAIGGFIIFILFLRSEYRKDNKKVLQN
jgi:Flp pilus assembly protein TadB